MKKSYLPIVMVMLLSSCATSYESEYFYNEILIINKSKILVQDVKVSAEATGRSFSCGNIAPRGICSNKIPRRRYLNSPITLTWVFGNTVRQTDEFILEVPATMSTEYPLRGVLEISPQGSIAAYFQQDTPIEN